MIYYFFPQIFGQISEGEGKTISECKMGRDWSIFDRTGEPSPAISRTSNWSWGDDDE